MPNQYAILKAKLQNLDLYESALLELISYFDFEQVIVTDSTNNAQINIRDVGVPEDNQGIIRFLTSWNAKLSTVPGNKESFNIQEDDRYITSTCTQFMETVLYICAILSRLYPDLDFPAIDRTALLTHETVSSAKLDKGFQAHMERLRKKPTREEQAEDHYIFLALQVFSMNYTYQKQVISPNRTLLLKLACASLAKNIQLIKAAGKSIVSFDELKNEGEKQAQDNMVKRHQKVSEGNELAFKHYRTLSEKIYSKLHARTIDLLVDMLAIQGIKGTNVQRFYLAAHSSTPYKNVRYLINAPIESGQPISFIEACYEFLSSIHHCHEKMTRQENANSFGLFVFSLYKKTVALISSQWANIERELPTGIIVSEAEKLLTLADAFTVGSVDAFAMNSAQDENFKLVKGALIDPNIDDDTLEGWTEKNKFAKMYRITDQLLGYVLDQYRPFTVKSLLSIFPSQAVSQKASVDFNKKYFLVLLHNAYCGKHHDCEKALIELNSPEHKSLRDSRAIMILQHICRDYPNNSGIGLKHA